MKTTIRLAAAACLAFLCIACSADGKNDVSSKPATNQSTSAPADEDSSEPASTDAATSAPASMESPTTTEAAPVEPADARASAVVQGNISPDFGPGEPGQLSVVAVGTAQEEGETRVPFVVRNNTASVVYNVEATGRVNDAGGQPIGSGSSQGFEPAALEPGHIGFGYVYISAGVSPSSTVEVTATGDSEESTFGGGVAMALGAPNLIDGQFGKEILGEVINGTDAPVSGPVSVLVLCVDQAGTLSGNFDGYTDGDADIPAGGVATYSVDLFDDPCPTFLVGASGYDLG